MNTEEGVSAQHFDVPVFKIESVMRGYGRRVGGRLVIKDICGLEVG